MTNYDKELEIALAAVSQAATVCQAIQTSIDPQAMAKKDRSPVTVADFASQALVCRALRDALPGDPVVGEEDAAALRAPEGEAFRAQVHAHLQPFGAPCVAQMLDWIDHGGAAGGSDRFWTLDPIDGTKGFLRGQQYAVALGLIVGGELTLSVLACPNLGFAASTRGMFWAVKGRGAFAGERTADAARLRVSTQSELAQTRLCESVESGHSSHDHSAQLRSVLGIAADSVRLDSQAKYAVVAAGEAEAYLRLPTRKDYREKIWDHAAGCLVVQEAGGTVTDVAGKALDFTHGRELVNNRGVVVTHGPFHPQILSALNEIGVR